LYRQQMAAEFIFNWHYRTPDIDWWRGNSLNLYFRKCSVQSRPRHRLSDWSFSWLYSVPPGKFPGNTLMSSR
jgi:hypothetical protein